METYSQKPVTFLYFWLNYCDENHHIEKILFAVENIDHLFNLASEIIEADRLHLFLLSDGTRIDDNEYLESLENGTGTNPEIVELFWTEKILKPYNISYPLDIE